MLSHIFAALKRFISNIESVPPKPKHLIKFVRKGSRAPRKKSPHVGILYHVLNWKLLTDLHDQYSSPPHIIFTQMHPGMVIFSNSTKKVILIKLTCPCKENMEKWHDEKLSKYLPLKTSIESNGWSVHLFAVEVGARGFCARSVMCCFMPWGCIIAWLNLPSKS